MVTSAASTVDQYLAELTPDRREIVETVRAVVNANLPDGYQEAMQYGMIGWSVPLHIYPAGYHAKKGEPLPYAALASQKQYVSLYLMGLYCGGAARTTNAVSGENGASRENEAAGETAEMTWFREAWLATGRKLNMGKSCVRFKKLDDVALDVVAQAIGRISVDEYIARYEAGLS